MKTLKTLALFTLLTLSSILSSFGGTNESSKDNRSLPAVATSEKLPEAISNPTLSDQIQKLLKYPTAAREQKFEGAVNFTFVIDLTGALHIKDISGNNTFLVNYVKQTLEGKTITTEPEKQGKLFIMPVIFKLI